MDTTEEYIRMCEKAEEIQENWARLPGDWAYNKILEKVIIFNRQTSSSNYSIAYTTEGETQIMTQEEWDKNKNVWLPRQDQLQEMLKITHLANPYSLVSFLWNVLNEDKSCPEEIPCEKCIKDSMYWRGFETMEQLWLAFVMKEKSNKVWNGKEWVKNG